MSIVVRSVMSRRSRWIVASSWRAARFRVSVSARPVLADVGEAIVVAVVADRGRERRARARGAPPRTGRRAPGRRGRHRSGVPSRGSSQEAKGTRAVNLHAAPEMNPPCSEHRNATTVPKSAGSPSRPVRPSSRLVGRVEPGTGEVQRDALSDRAPARRSSPTPRAGPRRVRRREVRDRLLHRARGDQQIRPHPAARMWGSAARTRRTDVRRFASMAPRSVASSTSTARALGDRPRSRPGRGARRSARRWATRRAARRPPYVAGQRQHVVARALRRGAREPLGVSRVDRDRGALRPPAPCGRAKPSPFDAAVTRATLPCNPRSMATDATLPRGVLRPRSREAPPRDARPCSRWSRWRPGICPIRRWTPTSSSDASGVRSRSALGRGVEASCPDDVRGARGQDLRVCRARSRARPRAPDRRDPGRRRGQGHLGDRGRVRVRLARCCSRARSSSSRGSSRRSRSRSRPRGRPGAGRGDRPHQLRPDGQASPRRRRSGCPKPPTSSSWT